MRILFLIVFLDLVGFGMIIPVFPFYAERIGVNPASVIFFIGLYSLGQLVGSPLWGALSDRIGRRPVLMVSLIGNVLACLLLAIADSAFTLAVSRVAAGLAAGNVATAFAYATDISTDESRPKALGLLGSAFGVGFIVGPAIGGLVSGNAVDGSGLMRVALVSALMPFLAFLLTAAKLPESLSAELRAEARSRPRSSALSFFVRPGLREVLYSVISVIGATAMFSGTLALWGAENLQLGPRIISWLYMFMGMITIASQLWFIGGLTKRFGSYKLAAIATAVLAVGMAAVPFSTNLTFLVIAIGVFGLGSSLVNPTFGNLVAGLSASHERGAALGAYQSAASLGRVLGPFSASIIAGFLTLSWPFWFGGVMSLCGIALIFFAMKRKI